MSQRIFWLSMADVPKEGSAAGAVECPGEAVRGSAKAVRNTEETRGPDEALRGLVLEVKPLVCLHDVLPSIRVSGLPPHTPLTLRADTHDDEGRKFSSCAHYTSDESGCVDVSSSESVGGSYTGVFPAGLLSSLRGVPDKFIRLWKTDCETPWKVKVTASQGHLELEDEAVGEVSQVLHRHLLGPGVRRVPVRHGRVRGALYLPAGPGPFPGVVDVFGGLGGLLEYRAAILASRGYAALALAYFSYDDLPKTLENLELDYFEEAVEFLLAQDEVIPDRCAVLSSSKGSDTALAMGIHLDKVKAVITIGGLLIASMTTLTYKGQQIWKGVDTNNPDVMVGENIDQTRLTKMMQEIFRHDHPLIPQCEKASNDTFFFLVAGDDDKLCTRYAAEAVAQRMKIHGRENNCRTIIYPKVGHILEMPYNAHGPYNYIKVPISSKGTMELKDIVIKWGGDPAGTCLAQEDFWCQLRVVIDRHIRDLSNWYQNFLQQSQITNRGN